MKLDKNKILTLLCFILLGFVIVNSLIIAILFMKNNYALEEMRNILIAINLLLLVGFAGTVMERY